jgi:hypothetical protein
MPKREAASEEALSDRPPLRLVEVLPEPDEGAASLLAERIVQMERDGQDSGELRAEWRRLAGIP